MSLQEVRNRPIFSLMRLRIPRAALLLVGMTVLYAAAALAGLALSSRSDGVFTFWPAAGIAAAAVANSGRKHRWAVVAAVGLGTIISALPIGSSDWSHALGVALANSLEAATAGTIIGRLLPQARRIVRRRDIGSMILAAAAGALVGSLVGGWATSVFFEVDLASSVLTWLGADALGIMLIGPGALALISVVRDHAPWSQWIRFGIAIAATGATVLLAMELRRIVGGQFAYLLLVPLMVTTIYVGQRGFAMLMALLSGLVVGLTEFGFGPFVSLADSRLHPVVAAQLFLLTIQVTMLFMSVEASRRRDALAEVEGVFDAALDAVLLVDETGTVRRANQASEKILGVERNALVGRRYVDFLVEPLDATSMISQHAMLTKAQRADGGEFWAEVSEGTVHQEARRPRRALILRDVTARISAQEQLEKLRDQFVANMTHELRTPLTSIIGYTDWLIEAAGDQQSKADLELIRASAGELQDLIDGILDFKRAASVEAEPTAVDFSQVVKRILRQLEPAGAAREVVLNAKVDPGVTVTGDLQQLERTVANLIVNAIKYSEPGNAVVVDLTAFEREARLLVADQGIGISAEDQARIFERFFRAGSAISAGIPGTGLGLALARDIARAHKGDLTLESSLGVGTTVTLRLPVRELVRSSAS